MSDDPRFSPQAKTRVDSYSRKRDVRDLTLQGKTVKEISEILEISVTQVRAAQELDKKEQLEIPTDQYRAVQLGRYEAMIDGLWERCTNGDHKAVMAAAKCLENIAKLMGLNKPLEVKQIIGAGSPAAARALIKARFGEATDPAELTFDDDSSEEGDGNPSRPN